MLPLAPIAPVAPLTPMPLGPVTPASIKLSSSRFHAAHIKFSEMSGKRAALGKWAAPKA